MTLLTCSYVDLISSAVMSIRGRMISSTSVLTKLTMPDSIWCSSRDEPRARSTASASSSIEISALRDARRLMRPPVRTKTYERG